MAVTDLTNTTWYFNEHPQKINPNRYDLTFTSNGESFTKIGNHYSTTYLYDLNYYYVDGGALRTKYAYESTSDASEVGLGSWSNQNYRTINITGGTDATNPDLIAWLEASATPAVVPDITRTLWLLNTDVSTDFPSSTVTFRVNFKSDRWRQKDYSLLVLNVSGTDKYVSYGYRTIRQSVTSNSAVFTSTNDRIIEISGGEDASNPSFVSWLEANGTKIEFDTDNYHRLDEIISDGYCAIDTGYQPSNKTHLYISTYYVAGNAWLFGARQTTASNSNSFGWLDNGTNWYSYYATTQAQVPRQSGNQNIIIDKRKNETTYYYGNYSGYITQSSASTVFSVTRNLYIFALNNGGNIASVAPKGSKLYECFIEDDGGLRAYFLPAMRKSDNAVGVYDCVNQTFLTNIYTGSFLGYRAEPEEGGTITCASDNVTATLTATANANYTFQDWNLANYTRLDYIENTGSQYFVTGFNCNNSTIVQLKHMIVESVQGGVIGSAWSGNALLIHTNSGTGGYTAYFGNPYAGVPTTLNEWYELELKSGSFTVNGTNYTVGTNIGSSYRTQLGVGMNSNGSTSYYSKGRYAYIKLWADSTTLSRYYVPVKRKSDNVAGMYDLVNGTFTKSATSTNFVAGNELGDFTLTDNPLTFALGANSSVIANFNVNYNVTLTYDSSLGSATYSIYGTNVNLVASPNANAQFVGWYLNSVLLSTSNPYSYALSGDVTIECRFDEVYDVTTSVDGNGAIDYTRGTDRNDVTFTVIPSANWSFEKYIVNGTEYTTTPLTIHLTQDTSAVAYFIEDDKFHLTVSTNFEYGSIYLSDNDVYSGTMVTVWARPFPDRAFVQWSDGETANPRNIEVTSNISLIAIFQRSLETNGSYLYRCFIKDQMHLTDYPKCFLKVDKFNVKRDLLTNANSTINVVDDLPEGINEGDILVLYDPKGTTLYQGVIKSSGEKKITCSQMESFYKGTWIYNIHASDSLEEEIAYLLDNYANGYIYRSNYQDPWVAQRLGGITVRYNASTTVHLPSDLDEDGNENLTELDMEKWIYELYETYGIVFRFTINIQGPNYVDVEVPSYETIKVGNNMYAIKDVSPITSIEETNRLIIFAQNKNYKTTYIATKNEIVEEPSTSENRFNITNTVIVYSDDDVADLIASNLPQQMYNHKLTFTLMIKNFLFEFGDFNLGGSIDVWKDDDYYNTVLTGYEIKKESNKNINSVDFICGKVRIALTKQLTRKGGL